MTHIHTEQALARIRDAEQCLNEFLIITIQCSLLFFLSSDAPDFKQEGIRMTSHWKSPEKQYSRMYLTNKVFFYNMLIKDITGGDEVRVLGVFSFNLDFCIYHKSLSAHVGLG